MLQTDPYTSLPFFFMPIEQNLTLIFTQRTYDWHVCLRDHPEIWACGRTRAEAVFDWLLVHGSDYGITILPQ